MFSVDAWVLGAAPMFGAAWLAIWWFGTEDEDHEGGLEDGLTCSIALALGVLGGYVLWNGPFPEPPAAWMGIAAATLIGVAAMQYGPEALRAPGVALAVTAVSVGGLLVVRASVANL